MSKIDHHLRWSWNAILAATCLSILTLPLSAQSSYGSIVGSVADSSGGLIPDATVTLTNLSTSETRKTVTDTSGNYRFVYLLPDNYKIDIEKTGFKRVTRTPVRVEVANSTSVNVTMTVGEVSQTVEVASAQGELLQTQDATVGQVVEGQSVQAMPLNGRNVMNLIALTAGVIAHGGSQGQTTRNGLNNYQVGGGMVAQGRVILDGAVLNLGLSDSIAFTPIQDTIQEFQVMENNLPPEYGTTLDGVVNLASKSGTNEYHVTAYEFLRNKVLNANPFFSNRAGLPNPAYVQNQYGLNGGGPILHDKLFFYGAWEEFIERVGTTFTATVPTKPERGGDFSSLLTAGGALIPIYDPAATCGQINYLTQTMNPACVAGQPMRTQFPNNMIPSTRFDKTASIMEQFWPMPNTNGQANTNANNYTANFNFPEDRNWETGRLDYNVSPKQRIFATFNRYMNSVLPFDPYDLGVYESDPQEVFGGVVADTYVLNPKTVADVRIGYYHDSIHLQGAGKDDVTPDLTIFGWPSSYNQQFFRTELPVMSVQGFTSTAGAEDGSLTHTTAQLQVGVTLYVAGSVTKIVGKHTLKFGGEWNWLPTSNQNTPASTFSFTTNFTAANPLSPGNTGSGFASYLLGLGSSGSVGNLLDSNFTQKNGAAYFGDTFQVSKSLTLNLGLRWEYIGYWTDDKDLATIFQPGATNPVLSTAGLNYHGDVVLVNSPRYPGRTNLIPHWDLFEPRVGAAYRLDPKTVVRLGFSLSYGPGSSSGSLNPISSPISTALTAWVPTVNSGTTPVDTLNNPFPNSINQPAGRNSSYERSTLGQSLVIPIPQAATPYIMNSNIDIQRQFSSKNLLEVSYVNTRAVHNDAGGAGEPNINQLPDQYDSLGSQLLTKVSNPFSGLVGTGTLASSTVASGQLMLPYPQYTTVQNNGAYEFEANYNALLVKFHQQLYGGGSILASYAWSKNLGNAETVLNNETSKPGAIQDYTNLKSEYSLISYNVPQRLVVSYVTELPFGRGRRLLNNLPGVADKLVSGWGADGVTSVQAGFPLPITASPTSLSSGFGSGTPRPIVMAGCAETRSGSAQSKLSEWFNTGCFSAPSSFGFGNESRVDAHIQEDGVINYDAALVKNTLIHEGSTLQFRVEAFNLFNRAQFGAPGGQFGTSTFGVVGTQVNAPREIQAALRFSF